MTAALRESSDDLVGSRLRAALRESGAVATEVVDLRRRAFAYETSFAIDELGATLEDGSSLRLLVKDVSPAGLSAGAVVAKPGDLIEPEREISVYRDLLAGTSLAAPRFLGASVDREEGRWWLFLEHVEGEVLTDVGEIETWRQAAAEAAHFASVTLRSDAQSRLLVNRDARWNATRIDAALAILGDAPEDSSRLLAERLRPRREALLEHLDQLPRAFVHGELYPSNVVIESDPSSPPRVAVVDWELAGVGPFALDLAALISGWGREDALSMCGAFHQSMPAGESPTATLDELTRAVDLCGLSLALQWIGWAPGWDPPEDHRHDWVAEAARLLDRAELR
jgi:Ser/Thr protein kinase RdoA (MazF antagonist)